MKGLKSTSRKLCLALHLIINMASAVRATRNTSSGRSPKYFPSNPGFKELETRYSEEFT